jgi:hypothetical protein
MRSSERLSKQLLPSLLQRSGFYKHTLAIVTGNFVILFMVMHRERGRGPRQFQDNSVGPALSNTYNIEVLENSFNRALAPLDTRSYSSQFNC